MHRRDLAGLRPDTPQWLDLRGLLFSSRCDVFANSDPTTGFVVCAWDMAVAVAAGRPLRSVVAAAVAGSEGVRTAEWHLLAPPESLEAIATTLPDWRRRGVTLHTRTASEPFGEPQTQSGIPAVTHHLRRTFPEWLRCFTFVKKEQIRIGIG